MLFFTLKSVSILILTLFISSCASEIVEELRPSLTKEVLDMISSIETYEAIIEVSFISNRGINVYEMRETNEKIEILAPESLKGNIINLTENTFVNENLGITVPLVQSSNGFLTNFLALLETLPKEVSEEGDIVTITLNVEISPYIYKKVLTTENKNFKSLISYDINGDARMNILFKEITLNKN